jgi:DNA-binding response OmpR family regulator
MRDNRFNVVLVEDNPADAEIFRIALAQENADIDLTHFMAGNEILEYFGVGSAEREGAGSCDLLLLDLNLPAISGFEILQRMRSETRWQKMPIIIMSGSSDPEEIKRCERLGATRYIRKPSQLTEIFAVGHEIVELLRISA